MTSLLRNAVLFLWVCGALGTQSTHASTVNPPVVSISRAASSVPATCPSRTINFITHTLAQQCLADRAHHTTIQASISNRDNVTTSSTSPELTVTLTQTVHPPTDTVTLEVTVSSEEGNVTVIASSTPVSSPATIATDDQVLKVSADAEEEGESPLDNVNFLSFEEWKNQNLAKVGQSPDDIGRGQPVDASRQRPGINNALDTLGEEHEISLDFAGFGGGPSPPVAESHSGRGLARPSPSTMAAQQDLAAQSLRSKDAGKTCKERTNYASFDCAATILKSNKECKSASSVLVEHKDSYMLNICEAKNKFFIVELCDDIQIDTIVLANYEFFSSSFRHFRISVSDRYPVKMEKWKDLGTFEARNTREIQAFLVQNPLIWARYLRIEFLSQYGLEYYCPVSVLRVHGTTMWEDYRHQEEIARGEIEEATLEVEALATPPVSLENVQTLDPPSSAPEAVSVENKSVSVSDTITDVHPLPVPPLTTSPPDIEVVPTTLPTPTDHDDLAKNLTQTTALFGSNTTTHLKLPDGVVSSDPFEASLPSTATAVAPPAALTSAAGLEDAIAAMENSTTSNPSLSVTSYNSTLTPSSSRSDRGQNATDTDVVPSVGDVPLANDASANATSQSVSSTNTTSQGISSTNTTRAVASTTISQPAQPSTQESFFKSFHKRLQQLESNSTLSLQYIEEQSRILRDAFNKVEKRQLATTTMFLSQLNDTVMAELHGFRQAYDQLWQSTVIELETNRESNQRELLALSSRLTMVADELVWQKRMGIVQSTLLLLCLALAIFTRSETGYLEVPLMQNMMNKSAAALRGSWESPPNSPSPDSRSSVSLFRRWRAGPDIDRSASDTDTSRPQSREQPEITIEAPSPNDRDTQSGYFEEHDTRGSLEKEPSEDKRGSPKKQRKKAKKFHGHPMANGRAKSPLAL